MRSCPHCKRRETLRPSRPRGVWERRLLPLVGLRPVRCAACRGRCLAFGSAEPEGGERPDEGDRPAAAAEAPAAREGFLPPADGRSFDEILRELDRAEEGAADEPPSARGRR